MSHTRLAKKKGSVHSLKYHIVFCPKYRRKVLKEPIQTRFKELVFEKCQELEFNIHAIDVTEDHVHIFIEADPRWAVSEIVNRLKGYTSNKLRSEFPELVSKLSTLWSRSYFASSVGSVTSEAIKKYIEDQKGK